MQFDVLYLIWKYSTLTSLRLLLMRKNLNGAWFKVGGFKKSLSTVPKSKHCAMERCRRLATLHSLFWNFAELFRKVLRIFRANFLIHSGYRFPIFKNLFILKLLNVLILKNSTDFKKSKQYYTILHIFEHFGCSSHWKIFPIIAH